LGGRESEGEGWFLGSLLFCYPTPLPPRSVGIFDLAGFRELIYGAQSLRGKILYLKGLGRIYPNPLPVAKQPKPLALHDLGPCVSDWHSEI
jgi:hypothetical protein